MITPRDYQVDARKAIWNYLGTKRGNPLVLMPTGTGKSVVIGDTARSMLQAYPQTRIVVATHVETLIAQNYEKLMRLWPTAPAGIYSAGLKRRDTMHQIIFAGVQSVFDKAEELGHVDILKIDEAHLVSPNDETMYRTFIDDLREINPKLKVIGFTATDWRLGLGNLTNGGIFTDVAIDMTTPEAWNWFVDNGYLSPLSSKKTNLRLDESGIGSSGGEFILSQQQAALDQEDLTRKAVEEMIAWHQQQPRNCWLVFGTGVEHCIHIADMLNEYGISAVAVHSKAKDAQQRLADWQAGKYIAAVSMNKLTTGVDAPQIDMIGVLRFTKSSSLWVQMLGRGTRPVYEDGYDLSTVAGRLQAIAAGPKPDGCLVLDFAHNTERLGPINRPVVSAPKGVGGRKGQGAPVRVCPICAEYVHASHSSCNKCGYVFAPPVRIHGEASTAEVMTRGAQPEPVVELIDVERVTYHVHVKRNNDKPPSLRVSYYAPGMMTKYTEYICFEHTGGPRNRAEAWWQERLPLDWQGDRTAPDTTQQAKALVDMLRTPKQIRVWTNAPYPRVMSYEFV